MNFKDLLIKHSYYASGSNYYSNDAGGSFATWQDFYAEFRSADIDMNLIYRWDLHEREDEATDEKLGSYYMEVFFIHQRKGVYAPFIIHNVLESDLESIKELMSKHWEHLQELWNPISKIK